MRLLSLLPILLLAAAVLGACGKSNSNSSTPTATPTAGPTSTPAPGEIDISADNLEFNTDKLTGTAGTVTIVFDNEDSGVAHNIHLRKGRSASGDSVEKTDIQSGPVIQVLPLTLEAGDYYFQCDVHPNMKGTLTVS